jgi:cysteinyl-tRNA synthetase
MKLHNTLTRRIDELTPLQDNTVRIYSCGPTVYDHAHIGNLSAYIFADTLRRAVQLAGHHVFHAMNYTDVDDKTIRRSHERYPDDDPKTALYQLTNEYIERFRSDMLRIGNDVSALTFLRATDHIEGMQALITQLHKQGFAYIAEDGVYFSIDAYRKSGKTYGQLLELTAANTSEARIQNDEYDKESAHDFALWKTQKDGEPVWSFTLDGHDLAGRPGWHIECSVMSRAALAQPFDIHTGGVDLIFPHHENEIAQSTAGEENPIMARFFAHNEHILVDGKKMAKSANNFYTLQDIIDKGFDPLAFRLLVLQSHYRNQVHFSWENLEAAQNRLKNWQAFADLRWQPKHSVALPNRVAEQIEFMQPQLFIKQQLADDLNTSEAITWLDRLADDLTMLPAGPQQLQRFEALLSFFDQAFGLQLAKREDISDEQKQLIAKREQVRAAKEWAKSDELRDKLAEQGIALRDTPQGTIWYRT